MLSKKNFVFFIFLLLYLNIAFADDCPSVISDTSFSSCATTNPSLLINIGGIIETSIPSGPYNSITVNNNMTNIVNNGAIRVSVDSGNQIYGIYVNISNTVESLINNGDI